MRKSSFVSICLATTLFSILFISTQVSAAPQTQIDATTPLNRPSLPADRLGLANPYSMLGDGLPDVAANAAITVSRGIITERMTLIAQAAEIDSPYHGTTWLTYYGRPDIPVMGILGEHDIEGIIEVLQEKAKEYEAANSELLSVTPAIHLVYGMATKASGDDGSHLAYLAHETVMDYITKAAEADVSVILDVQIGALSPTDSISPALKYLEYEHVHLAIDPEFAMVHPGQYWPGDPIGFLTGEQVNEVQSQIQRYLRSNRIKGKRVLLVHQFQSNMILKPEVIDSAFDQVAITISVDGWGGPWAKITKYNSFITPESPYAAFKLFYGWDEPLLTPAQALGEEYVPDTDLIIDVTPNMIIYQ